MDCRLSYIALPIYARDRTLVEQQLEIQCRELPAAAGSYVRVFHEQQKIRIFENFFGRVGCLVFSPFFICLDNFPHSIWC